MGSSLKPVEQVTADRFHLRVNDELRPPFPPVKSPATLGRGEPGPPTLTVLLVPALTLCGVKELIDATFPLWVFQFTVKVPTDE